MSDNKEDKVFASPEPPAGTASGETASNEPQGKEDDARSIAGSEKSVASNVSRTGIPKLASKAGGTRTSPMKRDDLNSSRTSLVSNSSKIGRPCCAGKEKPALPAAATPTKNSSVILTEDTDSFMIGQRAWVNGTKPGQIAYIGETQFAPGDWAGVVLDQPIGKNDGSVAGIRYFQCEPKRGVFSRLTRLTRYPLPGADLEDVSRSYSPSLYSSTVDGGSARRRSTSPPLSTSSALANGRRSSAKSPSNASNVSFSMQPVDFKIGDRVIIKSSQGSKIGVLRYMGYTSFANGEWCGVELDEPRGKNDGCVDGRRYFDCRPNHGLFALVSKVSKSPSNRKPGFNCVIHSNSGMRRGGSRESLLSMNSSLTSASAANMPRREVLKEKQQHIEQLLKERDLERAEITRAANQADEAEQKLANFNLEYLQYRAESDDKLKALEKEMKELSSQLDEEKRKNEDLQFRFDENDIIKSDFEASNLKNSKKLEEFKTEIECLQRLLNEEDLKRTILSQDFTGLQEENENLKVSLEHANEKRSLLEMEENKSIDLVQSLQSQLEEAKNETKKHQENATNEREEFEMELSKLTSSNEIQVFALTKQLEELKSKYEIEVASRQESSDTLLNELKDLREQLEVANKSALLQKEESLLLEAASKKETNKLKMEISGKVNEIETLTEKLQEKSKQITTLEENFNKSHVDIIKNHETNVEKLREDKENLQTQLETLTGKLQESFGEIERNKTELKALKDTEEISKSTNKQLLEAQEEIQRLRENFKEKSEKLEEFTKLNEDLEDTSGKLKCKLEETASLLQNTQLELGDFKRNLAQIETELVETKKSKANLENEVQTLSGNVEDSAKLEILSKELKERDANLEKLKEESNKKISHLEHTLQSLELQSNKASEDYEVQKQILAKKVSELESHLKNSEEKLQNLEIFNGEYHNKIASLESGLQSAEVVSKKAYEEYEVQKQNLLKKVSELEEQLKFSVEKIESLHKENEIFKQTNETSKNDLQNELKQLQSTNEELNTNLKQSKETGESLEAKIKELQTEIHVEQTKNKELFEKIESNNKTREELTNKLEMFHLDASKSKEVGLKANEEIENLKKVLVEREENAKKSLEEISLEHKQKIEEYQKILEEKENQNKILQSEIANSTKSIEENGTKIADLQKLLETNKEALAKQSQECLESKNQNEKFAEEITKHLGKIAELQVTLKSTNSEVSNQVLEKQQEIDRLAGTITEKSQLLKTLEEKSAKELEEKCSQLDKIAETLKQQEVINRESLQTNEELNKKFEETLGLLQKLKEEKEHFLKQTQNESAKTEEQNKTFENFISALKLTKEQKDILSKSVPESITNRIEVVRDPKEERVIQLEDKAQRLTEDLKKTEKLLRERDTIIFNTRKEIHQLKNDSKEKQNLGENTELLEDKNFMESKVDFLNSIIVDMQKKNEEQKAHIELLESGYSPALADEFKLYGMGDKKVTIRIYCDICEVFDAHETEDCPKQESDDMPATPIKKKEKPPPREYCELCEMFGHSTENCKEETSDETY